MDFWLFVQLHDQKQHGIIRRDKGDEATQYYNFARPASFGEKQSLLLPRVTPQDSGSYECAISANVRGRNLNLQVDLIVNGELLGSFPPYMLHWLKIVRTRFFFLACHLQILDF